MRLSSRPFFSSSLLNELCWPWFSSLPFYGRSLTIQLGSTLLPKRENDEQYGSLSFSLSLPSPDHWQFPPTFCGLLCPPARLYNTAGRPWAVQLNTRRKTVKRRSPQLSGSLILLPITHTSTIHSVSSAFRLLCVHQIFYTVWSMA